jgi:hypothetical protein
MDFFASLGIILSGHPEPESMSAPSTPIDAESIGFGYGGCVVA